MSRPRKPVHRCVQWTVENGQSRSGSISGSSCGSNRRMLHLGRLVHLSRLDSQLFGCLSTNCHRLPELLWYLDFVVDLEKAAPLYSYIISFHITNKKPIKDLLVHVHVYPYLPRIFWFLFLWLMATGTPSVVSFVNHFRADCTLAFQWLSCRDLGGMTWPGCLSH